MIEEYVYGSPNVTVKYCYDGDQVVAEYEDGDLVRKYIYGPGIDEPIMMITVSGGNETKYYYHFDGLGSVVALSNNSRSIIEEYGYDVFGEPNRTSSVGNPYLFTGRQIDEETGLYYYRARYYNPNIGRFLQTDPIGYKAGFNLYAYVYNNPVMFSDPTGMDGYSVILGPGGYPIYTPGGCCGQYKTRAELLGLTVSECIDARTSLVCKPLVAALVGVTVGGTSLLSSSASLISTVGTAGTSYGLVCGAQWLANAVYCNQQICVNPSSPDSCGNCP